MYLRHFAYAISTIRRLLSETPEYGRSYSWICLTAAALPAYFEVYDSVKTICNLHRPVWRKPALTPSESCRPGRRPNCAYRHPGLKEDNRFAPQNVQITEISARFIFVHPPLAADLQGSPGRWSYRADASDPVRGRNTGAQRAPRPFCVFPQFRPQSQ